MDRAEWYKRDKCAQMSNKHLTWTRNNKTAGERNREKRMWKNQINA